MVRRGLIAVLLSGSLLSLAAMISPAVSPRWFAASTLAFPAILIGISRLRYRRPGPALAPALALLLLMQGAGWFLLGTGATDTGPAGLPIGAWVLLLGFGALPLPLLASWFAAESSAESTAAAAGEP